LHYAIIIGAGPAGLTAAYELLTKTDIIPIIIEQDTQPGGLSKTIDYHGNKMDIGGHRFFSKSEKVIKWWLHFLPLEPGNANNINIHYQGSDASFNINTKLPGNKDGFMMLRQRKSRIYFQQKFFDYPLRVNLKTLQNLGFLKTFHMGCSYFYAKLFPLKDEQNLAQFYTNRFGKELYKTFFKDYTEKVWGVPCEKLPATWGKQRIKNLNVGKVLKHAFKSLFTSNKTIQQTGTSTSLIEQFMYPKYGPGQMWETVAKEIEALGGKIQYNTTLTSLNGNEAGKINSAELTNNITGEKQTISGDYFFSTMPIGELILKINKLLIPEEVQKVATSLEYRDFMIVGVLTNELAIKEKNAKFTDNWIYIQDKNIKAGRIQFFHNWSPYMVNSPEDTWIGVEYFCNETDTFWHQDNKTIANFAISEMHSIHILNPQQVKDTLVVKVKKAYPSYFGGYKNFNIVQHFFDNISNLYLIGRNGMHRYNNSDHSMLTAMAAVENIITGRKDKKNIWEINTEDEYHEEQNASV
jgi:protoporphyrinogen oxidase